MKPNQQKLKYLNSDSTHTKATFAAIPNGVLVGRLNRLTSKTKRLENATVDKIYPHHAQALQIITAAAAAAVAAAATEMHWHLFDNSHSFIIYHIQEMLIIHAMLFTQQLSF